MRKLFWQMNVTLDGFMEGPKRELDDTAQVVNEDFDQSLLGGSRCVRRECTLNKQQRRKLTN
jgi:hypothetical protein